MKYPFPITILLLTGLVLSSPAFAQSEEQAASPSAEQLLSRVAQTYRQLEDYYFQATETTITRSEDFERKSEVRYLTAGDSHGRARVEVFDRTNDRVAVFDGETTWVLAPELGQYMQRTSGPLIGFNPNSAEGAGLDVQKSAGRYLDRYSAVDERLAEARIARRLSGATPGETEVFVVEAQYNAPAGVPQGKIRRTFWIDQQRALILQEKSVAEMKRPDMPHPVEVTQTIEFRTIRTQEEVSADTFIFDPPENAELVDRFGPASKVAQRFVGRPAPDFALTSLREEGYQLSDLRGKVVLLDFWATWCTPCRIDLPHIEALHQEFASQGLVVLGINGESPKRAGPFFEEHGYSFPSLVDRGNHVARQYRVDSLPTVVIIDRSGKISSYLVGLHPVERLRAELKKAGIE